MILADDDVSTQAILFNVLSVSFLLGADDKLYDIVIPSAIEKVVDAFVEETVQEAENDGFCFECPFILTRCVSVIASFSMALIIWFFSRILDGEILPTFFGQDDCDGFGLILVRMGSYIMGVILAVRMLHTIVEGRLNRELTTTLLDFYLITTSVAIGIVAYFHSTDFEESQYFGKESRYIYHSLWITVQRKRDCCNLLLLHHCLHHPLRCT